MAADETNDEVLRRVYFWTMILGIGFVGSGAVITFVLTN